MEKPMSHDSHLQKAVLAELAWEPSVKHAHIGATANAGVVTLTGHVESYAQKHAAETAAGRVKGVKAVAEEIEVRLPFDRTRDDGDIAAAILERLDWDVSIPRHSIKVRVENGWVTLTGEVGWHYQSDAGEQDVRGLHGVIGISNQTTIRPAVSTATITDDIKHALHRSWFFDADGIRVTSDHGKVHLTGTVNSPHDRALAAKTAWSAPGATSVENDITVV